MADDDVVETDDIVEIGVRDRKPVLCTSERYDHLVNLRVLGTIETENTMLYLMLVTGADDVSPTCKIDKWRACEYEVEDRFVGEDGIIVSDSHIRRIALKQNGRFCSRCKDYNRDVRIPKNLVYVCLSCVLNPYR